MTAHKQLTQAQQTEILRRMAAGETGKKLAIEFGVGHNTPYNLRQRAGEPPHVCPTCGVSIHQKREYCTEHQPATRPCKDCGKEVPWIRIRCWSCRRKFWATHAHHKKVRPGKQGEGKLETLAGLEVITYREAARRGLTVADVNALVCGGLLRGVGPGKFEREKPDQFQGGISKLQGSQR